MSIAVNTVRIGKKYALCNYGEKSVFQVEDILSRDDFVAKDLLTLEKFKFSDLVEFGKGKDYLLEEIR